MTYYESAEGLNISRERALRELDKHGIVAEDIALFFEEVGDREQYSATEVLNWLGY